MTKSETRMTIETANSNDETANALLCESRLNEAVQSAIHNPQCFFRFIIAVSFFIRHSNFVLRHY